MALKLLYHPLSSYCHKVLIALYENETAFTPSLVDLMDDKQRADFLALWPVGKFPVLVDDKRDLVIPESTVIIEYLGLHYPGPVSLVPAEPEAAWQVRRVDRFFDLYVMTPMQSIVADRLVPEDKRNPSSVDAAKQRLKTSYQLLDKDLAGKTWAAGEAFSMADCAAAPALYYADKVLPFTDTHENVTAYFERLLARPSYARVLKEAEPYLAMFPG